MMGAQPPKPSDEKQPGNGTLDEAKMAEMSKEYEQIKADEAMAKDEQLSEMTDKHTHTQGDAPTEPPDDKPDEKAKSTVPDELVCAFIVYLDKKTNLYTAEAVSSVDGKTVERKADIQDMYRGCCEVQRDLQAHTTSLEVQRGFAALAAAGVRQRAGKTESGILTPQAGRVPGFGNMPPGVADLSRFKKGPGPR